MPYTVKKMIASVKARQTGSQNFFSIYTQLCALQDSCPLLAVKEHLDEGVLDLNADRIRLADWAPILNSLRINKTLHKVCFRSHFKGAESEGGTDVGKYKFRPVQKPPPIRSKEVAHKMCVCLKECLQTSDNLQDLFIENIPLRRSDMQCLSKGVFKSRNLQNLSLECCRIGDGGVEALFQGIRNSQCLKAINLSGCGLTRKGIESLAKIIKHQSTNRHSEAWKDSLRYRKPDLDMMPGLRRITMNNNPLIGDDGAAILAEALRDDLWLKALDMQHCGITNCGAQAFLEALHENSTIMVLDIRQNLLIDHKILKRIIEQVLINARGREDDYQWIQISSPKNGNKQGQRKRQKKTVSSKRTKTKAIKASSGAKPSSSVIVHGYDHGDSSAVPRVRQPGPGFVPWRTAARAEHRGIPSAEPIHQSTVVKVFSPRGRASQVSPTSHLYADSPSASSEIETSVKDSSQTPSTHMFKLRDTEQSKDTKVQLEELKRRLQIESRARAAADERLMELELENTRLRQQLRLKDAQLSYAAPNNSREKNGGLDMDDELLQSIEESFKKFHAFLDLLRDAGLGQLCSLIGLSAQDLQKPEVSSILRQHQPASHEAHPVSNPTIYIAEPYREESFARYEKPKASQSIYTSVPQPDVYNQELSQYTFHSLDNSQLPPESPRVTTSPLETAEPPLLPPTSFADDSKPRPCQSPTAALSNTKNDQGQVDDSTDFRILQPDMSQTGSDRQGERESPDYQQEEGESPDYKNNNKMSAPYSSLGRSTEGDPEVEESYEFSDQKQLSSPDATILPKTSIEEAISSNQHDDDEEEEKDE